MSTFLERRWGGGGKNPSIDELRSALAELTTPDPEHPDTWLEDDKGWVVIVDETGTVVLADARDEVCRRESVTPPEALQLWLLKEQYDEIRRRLSA